MSIQRRTSARRRVGAAALSLTGLTGGLAGSALAVAPAATAATYPAVIDLPRGFQPEGVAAGAGTTFFAGSVANGAIYKGDLRTGRGALLWKGGAGHSLRGMQYDPRTGLLWVVGNIGTVSKVWAVSALSGAVGQETVVPGGIFLNDVVVTSSAVFVTDSAVDRVTRIALTAGGRPAGQKPTFVPLSGSWPKTAPNTFGANGIRQLSNGELVLNNSAKGGLYSVNPRSGSAAAIRVTGGPALKSGDGLELNGSTLYDVRGTGQGDVSVLGLVRASGTWRATYLGTLKSSQLAVPTTATVAAGGLYTVNAKFGISNPQTASYTVKRLPLRP